MSTTHKEETAKAATDDKAATKKAKHADGPETVTVAIKKNGFSPARVDIKSGDTVTWTNEDAHAHTIKFSFAPAPPPPAKISKDAPEPAAPVKKIALTEQDKALGNEHGTCTDDADLPPAGNVRQGADYSFTFTTPGTYEYGCEVTKSMRGSVVVSA